MSTIRIRVPLGHELEANLYLPPSSHGSFPAILFLHGWGGTQDRFILAASRMAESDFVCLTLDLSGHGCTQRLYQSVTAQDNLADTLSAYDKLVELPGVDPNRMCVVGSSYGGFLAALLSRKRRVEWLVLRSPALYRDSDFENPKFHLDRTGLMEFRRQVVTPEQNVALCAASQFRGDVLIVESENDLVTPPRQILNFIDAFRDARSLKHHVIRGADHGLSQPEWRAEAREVLAGWLGERRLDRSATAS